MREIYLGDSLANLPMGRNGDRIYALSVILGKDSLFSIIKFFDFPYTDPRDKITYNKIIIQDDELPHLFLYFRKIRTERECTKTLNVE